MDDPIGVAELRAATLPPAPPHALLRSSAIPHCSTSFPHIPLQMISPVRSKIVEQFM